MVLRHLVSDISRGEALIGAALPDWLLAIDDDTFANPLTLLTALSEQKAREPRVFGHRYGWL